MFIPDPDFLPIPDPGSRIQKQRGVNKICCHTFFCSHKFHKIVIFLKCWRTNLGQFSKNYRTFYTKNCHPALKNMDLGSSPYSGSRIQGSKRQRIPDPDPQHWIKDKICFCFFRGIFGIQHCFICCPSIPLCRWMLGLSPGLLRLWHWQSDPRIPWEKICKAKNFRSFLFLLW